LLARANDLSLEDPRLFEAARATGADVPVCLQSRACLMRGVGDVLSDPLSLVPLPCVLVNPGVAVATKDVFAAVNATAVASAGAEALPVFSRLTRGELVEWLAGQRNDLEPAAISLQPVIGQVLDALRGQPGCRLARMSGSGATCFGLFDDETAAKAAAGRLAGDQPGWWVRADVLS
jgi:4-diphosphocytidyl-2-C-methyl-D-erythritol kinase